jgi:hypothetical protein
VFALCIAAGTFAAVGSARETTSDGVRFRVRVGGGRTARILQASLAEAGRRLERPACAALLDDYEDAAGQPLRRRLDDLDLTPPAYLKVLLFVDGQSHFRCEDESVLAATTPGSSVIHVCPQFGDHTAENPRLAIAAVIHEALHSLGLGENPPSSQSITAAVMRRCL